MEDNGKAGNLGEPKLDPVLLDLIRKELYDADELQTLRNAENSEQLYALLLDYDLALEDIIVEDVPIDYTGPHIGEKIDEQFIKDLIALFTTHVEQSNMDSVLHEVYANEIIESVIALLEDENCLNDLSVPAAGTLTVVGDTHGQLLDVLTIFKIRGMPSESNIFLFNGDFVDRGPHGVETLLLLYSLKVYKPFSIYLNRGNHEQRRMNERYKFQDQVLDRYNRRIFDRIQDSFALLPLGVVINQQILVIHGGLFPHQNITLKDLREQHLPHHSELKGQGDEIIESLLWSDPKPNLVGCKISKRGSGFYFGKDISHTFLDNNGLSMLIRSHVCEKEGYATCHDDRVVTIFSASYYGKKRNNKGAVIVFEGKDISTDSVLKPSYTQFYASAYAMTDVAINDTVINESLQQLRERIYASRQELMEKFGEEQNRPGIIPIRKWEATLKLVLKLSLPFIPLLPYLTTVTADSKEINYIKFLAQFQLKTPRAMQIWISRASSIIAKNLTAQYGDIEHAFKSADTDGDGELSYEEFSVAMSSLDKLTVTSEQIFDLAVCIDENADGSIQYDEFIAKFATAPSTQPSEPSNDLEPWCVEQIGLIWEILVRSFPGNRHVTRCGYNTADKNASGSISKKEFNVWCKESLKLEYDSTQIEALFGFIDGNHSKRISYGEFKKVMNENKPGTESKSSGCASLLSEFVSAFATHSVQLNTLFRTFDSDRNGSLDKGEFMRGMIAFNSLLPSPVEEEQLELLFDILDDNKDGGIDYSEFLGGFQVVDTSKQ